MNQEIQDLMTDDVFEIMPITQKPKDKKLIIFIWIFKRKISLTEELIEHKARLCVHGGMQERGEDCKNAFTPVVNWSTADFLLTIPMINRWSARHIDRVLAFSQENATQTFVYHYQLVFMQIQTKSIVSN